MTIFKRSCSKSAACNDSAAEDAFGQCNSFTSTRIHLVNDLTEVRGIVILHLTKRRRLTALHAKEQPCVACTDVHPLKSNETKNVIVIDRNAAFELVSP